MIWAAPCSASMIVSPVADGAVDGLVEEEQPGLGPPSDRYCLQGGFV